MLSTSSDNFTEQTNFINVETEPFTDPLRVESTENEKENDAPNNDLASKMEKLEVSRVSVDLFSQLTSSSFSLPPNRVLSNKENIDNISQRISNIHMSDNVVLADTQPNTSSLKRIESKKTQFLADTQPNSSPIPLSSDDEDDNNVGGGGNNEMIESLLTEESEEDEDEDDDSVIEILSSENSFESASDRLPRDVSALNTQTAEITDSVAQKLNHFFDNIPNLNVSQLDYGNSADLEQSVNVSETEASNNKNSDDQNRVQLQSSQLDENLDKSGELSGDKSGELSGDKSASQVVSYDEKEESVVESSLHRSRIDESDETSDVYNEHDRQSIQNDSDNMGSAQLNQSTDEPKKMEFEKIKTSAKSVITLNSPIINISAKVNINIQLTGFSSSTNSSESGETTENAPSEEPSETSVNKSKEFTAHCRKEGAPTLGFSSKSISIDSPNHKTTGDSTQDSADMSPDSSIIESSVILHSPAGSTDAIQNKENSNSSTRDSLSSLVDLTKELIVGDTSATKESENSAIVSTIDTSVEIDEIGEQLLTDIYGDTWRTPQLIKKCMSTKKKCFTDVPRRDISRGFSLCEYARPMLVCRSRKKTQFSKPFLQLNVTFLRYLSQLA